MLFLARLVPALLAASSVAHAASVLPRSNDDFFSAFIDALNKNNLTVLADNYKNIAESNEGKHVIDALQNNGDITILAPENDAFDSDRRQLDANTLLYGALQGNIDKNFLDGPGGLLARRAALHTRWVVPTLYLSSGGSRKRDLKYQGTSGGRKVTKRRWIRSQITWDLPEGDTEVIGRFEYQNIIFLIIDEQRYLPTKVSDLLSKRLIKDAHNGFSKSSGALKKTGLSDDVDNREWLSLFVPVDESFGDLDKYSKDDLSRLVKNHIIYGKRVFTPQFGLIAEEKSASGKTLVFSTENGVDYVCCGDSKATVIRGDVFTENGVLHVIDKPLKCD
ncbi:unnamed protein product [Rhizoctonia solani]|uniref:FAS1 domain-containing protein n=1 Tax=Rhizoctonia solani TaxID=456999 RepID=A0A8H3DWV4_9AGAM|nr:unnamed protein product [Rhizoctonia solani]